ncbi:hypothetical protein SAZ11_48525 [Streptomyces sp. FXJ1.4098]|nr:hypothetical protein [Streptomyces sp. FXJ1.4098]
MLVLVLISLGQVGRILRLPHERWLFLHRFTGLLLLSALVHGWFLDLVINGSAILLALYVTMATVGLAAYAYAYAYDELVLRRREPQADYTIRRVSRPATDIVDLSVAGVQPDGSVRLTVRALGRGTQKLYTDVREGLPVTLNGPYGMFDHTLGGPRQIWIAGGIGIAPFLGWLTHPSGTLPQADLFYCAPTADTAPFLAELTEAAECLPGLRLHPTFSRSQSHLTADRIRTTAGPLMPETHVFLCGPRPWSKTSAGTSTARASPGTTSTRNTSPSAGESPVGLP